MSVDKRGEHWWDARPVYHYHGHPIVASCGELQLGVRATRGFQMKRIALTNLDSFGRGRPEWGASLVPLLSALLVGVGVAGFVGPLVVSSEEVRASSIVLEGADGASIRIEALPAGKVGLRVAPTSNEQGVQSSTVPQMLLEFFSDGVSVELEGEGGSVRAVAAHDDAKVVASWGSDRVSLEESPRVELGAAVFQGAFLTMHSRFDGVEQVRLRAFEDLKVEDNGVAIEVSSAELALAGVKGVAAGPSIALKAAGERDAAISVLGVDALPIVAEGWPKGTIEVGSVSVAESLRRVQRVNGGAYIHFFSNGVLDPSAMQGQMLYSIGEPDRGVAPVQIRWAEELTDEERVGMTPVYYAVPGPDGGRSITVFVPEHILRKSAVLYFQGLVLGVVSLQDV